MVPPKFFNRMNESKPLFFPSIENILDSSISSQLPSSTNSLDSDMNQILNKTNLNDREKWSQYYQILQRYFHQNKNQRQPVQVSIDEIPLIGNTMADQNIVSTYPPTLRRNVEPLLNWIKRSNADINWDNQGVVKIN